MRWLVFGSAGLAALVAIVLARGTSHDVLWYLTHVGTFVVLALVVSLPIVARVTTLALAAYAIVLPTLAVFVGFTPFDPWSDAVRVQLFTPNPNMLAADLVAVFVAATVLRPRGMWAAWLIVVAIAVVLTGSRTALLALAVASTVWMLVPSARRLERGLLVAGVAGAVAFVLLAAWYVEREFQLDNLVRVSTTFDGRDWTSYGDSVVDVDARATEGPWTGTTADRIRANTTSSRLTLYQSLGRSVTGTQYVASVYLRADEPQVVVLSNHLARLPCDVTTTWTRCVTPPGEGNDRSAIQFRFEVVAPGDGFDVFAFGPQYEIGTAASAYQPRTGGLVPRAVIARFSGALPLDATRLFRGDQAAAARAAFISAPLFGAGRDWTDGHISTNGQPINHAHNAALEHLAIDGALGAGVWLALLAAMARLLVAAFGVRALVWIAALVVLNTFDYTLFHAGSYLAGAVLTGAALQRLDSRAE